MRRLFGDSRTPKDAPTLSGTVGKLEGRADELQQKIARCDAELLRIKQQLARAPGNEGLRRQAMQVLQQKRAYEAQRTSLLGQSMNLEQAAFAQDNLRTAGETVGAMRAASKEMRTQMRTVRIDDVEDLHADLADLMAESSDVAEVLSRSYATPDTYLDDADLENELAALESESLFGDEMASRQGAPSYLDLPSAGTALPESKSPASRLYDPALPN